MVGQQLKRQYHVSTEANIEIAVKNVIECTFLIAITVPSFFCSWEAPLEKHTYPEFYRIRLGRHSVGLSRSSTILPQLL